MVEINNQRKAFLDMLAWSEGTDNGRQKTINHTWRHCRRAIYWLLRSPSNLSSLNPKLKSTGAGRYQLLSRWWDAYRKQFGLKDFSPKSQDAVALQQIKERGALPMIDRGDIRQAPTVAAISGLHCRALVMVSSSIRLTAWLQNSKKRRNGQRDWCMSRVTAIISALVICIIVCLSWAVNHYRDNAITYKAQRTKMPENWSWRTRQLLTCRCVSVMLLRSMQNTRRSWAMLKLKMMPAWWCLPLVVVGCRNKLARQSVREAIIAPAWIMQLPRLADTKNGIAFTREGWSLCKKTTGREPRSILMSSADRAAHIDGQLMQLLWAIHTRFQRSINA